MEWQNKNGTWDGVSERYRYAYGIPPIDKIQLLKDGTFILISERRKIFPFAFRLPIYNGIIRKIEFRDGTVMEFPRPAP